MRNLYYKEIMSSISILLDILVLFTILRSREHKLEEHFNLY